MLLNFDPPATDEEMYAAALQYVRKVSGTRAPSKANVARFESAVAAITQITKDLIENMETTGAPKDREIEKAKAKARNAKRFATA
jgi:hypothetical protein